MDDIKKLLREISRPIKIKSKKYGNFDLMPLAAGDFSFLYKLIALDLPARDFTVKIIRRKLRNPVLGEREIKAFPDDRLIFIATKFIKENRMSINDLPIGKITYELFKQKIVEDVTETGKKTAAVMAPHLPWLIDFRDNWSEDIEQAEEVLKKCGYRHTINILEKEGFKIFANLQSKTAVTNIWLKATQQDWFKDELQERFQKSAILRRRWSIIESALEAHRRQDYLLSVPVLFTQIEGILGDALILNHKAKTKGGKLFASDSSGREIELTGISAIIDQPYFKGISCLEVIIKFLHEDKIVNERNAILHGRKISYGRAKLSTQSLLLVYVLIRDAAEFEPPIVIT